MCCVSICCSILYWSVRKCITVMVNVICQYYYCRIPTANYHSEVRTIYGSTYTIVWFKNTTVFTIVCVLYIVNNCLLFTVYCANVYIV